MKRIFAMILLLVIGGGMVSGCVIEPWGGGYGHHRHWER